MFWYRSVLLLLLAMLGLLTGCGDYSPAAPTDAAEAKRSLAEVLDAWQQRRSSQSLAEQPTPLYVSDHDWSQGKQLLGYEIKGNGRPFGNNVHFDVLLNLRDSAGKPRQAAAVYVVATDPVISITRSDAQE